MQPPITLLRPASHRPRGWSVAAGFFGALLLAGCGRSPEAAVTTSSPEALLLYKEGVSAMQRFYYAEAESLMERALELDSTFAMARARHAILHLERKDDAKVREEMERAVRDGAAATDREQMYLRAWNHMVNFRSEEEARVLDSLFAKYPRESEAATARGLIYEKEQNLEAAIKMYEQALKADTSCARAAMLLGYAHSTAGNHERAIAYMKRYIGLDPASADPRASLADLLLRVGDYDGALDQYAASLEVKPDYWYAMQQIGTIRLAQGRLREAEEMYLQGLRELAGGDDTQEANILAVQGLIEAARGRNEAAIELYRRAFALDSLNQTAAYGIARALIELGKFEQAEEVIGTIGSELVRRGMGRSAAMVGYHLMRARLHHRQGDDRAALASCDSAMQFSNQLSRQAVHLSMAEIHLAQGSLEDALGDCDAALAVNRNYPHALLVLTKVYRASGDKVMTGEVGGRLLEFWKDADPDFKLLGELKEALRKPV